jgi:hypothetical protein
LYAGQFCGFAGPSSASSVPYLFPCTEDCRSTNRPLETKASRFILLSVSLLQSSFASLLLARDLSIRASPTKGFGPLARHSWAGPPTRGKFPNPIALFRPQAFATSRRLSPHRTIAGLFHPADHVQGSSSRSGVSLSAQPPSLIGRSFPHAVGAQALTDRSRLPHPTASTSRLSSTQSRVPAVRG